MVKQEHKHISK